MKKCLKVIAVIGLLVTGMGFALVSGGISTLGDPPYGTINLK